MDCLHAVAFRQPVSVIVMFQKYKPMENQMKKNDDDYKVQFQGSTISKTNANKAGLGLIFGIAGGVFSINGGTSLNS